jgi:hypothetical protein
MKMENAVRAWAGTIILLSVLLTVYVSPYFIWLTVFAGANLLQSAFTNFCIAEIALKRCGVGKGQA